MLRRCTLTAALAALLSTAALAADLPVLKAPVYTGYPSSRGCYAGLGAAAEVAKASVTGIDTGASLYTAGAAIDVAVGCAFLIGGTWAAVEVDATYMNLGGNTVCAVTNCAIGSTWGFSQGVLFGFPWTDVMGYLPSFGGLFGGSASVPLPPGITSTSSRPYIGAWLHENDVSASFGLMNARAWQLTPSIGLGAIHNIACGTCVTKNLVLDTRVEYEFNDSSFAFGPAGAGVTATRGSAVITKAIFKY